MSIIFGIKESEGEDVYERQLFDLARATDQYAPDGTFVRAKNHIGMGFQPYHTHQRSNLESQPVVGESGNMLTLDGRLDNQAELCDLLDIHGSDTPDSLIVLAAFERWGEECFSRFVGDWALAIWSRSTRTLYLARDHAGTRTLYFERRSDTIVWATFLETFFVKEKSREIDRTYAARYLACQPICDLTPYKGITAVSPAHFVVFHGNKVFHKPHWQWVPRREVRYKTDVEYEQHFFQSLRLAVKRRIGGGAPIVAQLSGGIDSASIVSMADHVRAIEGVPSELLNTISFYDDTEPDWNERPYFSQIEAARGRRGIHVPVSFGDRSIASPDPGEGTWFMPGFDLGRARTFKTIDDRLRPNGVRSVLSGIGGDELLGGVPTPLPELADHLAAGRVPRFLDRSIQWSLVNRTPVVHMVRSAIGFCFGLYRSKAVEFNSPPPWVPRHQQHIDRDSRKRDPGRRASWSRRPSSIAKRIAWWTMLETLPNLYPTPFDRREYRYPYLDKELVEFLSSVPREQLVRPGQRRSLMRRSLKDIVPDQVLNRKRKGIVSRGPLRLFERSQKSVEDLFRDPLLASWGLIDVQCLLTELRRLLGNRDPTWSLPLLNTVYAELWLQACKRSGQLSH